MRPQMQERAEGYVVIVLEATQLGRLARLLGPPPVDTESEVWCDWQLASIVDPLLHGRLKPHSLVATGAHPVRTSQDLVRDIIGEARGVYRVQALRHLSCQRVQPTNCPSPLV